MTIQELKDCSAIYLPNIQDGFNNYHYKTLLLDEAEAFTYFHNLCTTTNYNHIYVDFDYYTLDTDAKLKVNSMLSIEELAYFDENIPSFSNIFNELIFPLDETLLRIICKLNATATLFSTIYFTDIPRTFWGNYNQEYIIFS